MASRLIIDCEEKMQVTADQFIQKCHAAGHELIITCTYRSDAEQEKLYRQGRTEPGSILTHARAGQSLHNCMINDKPASRAIDVVPIIKGKPLWQTQGAARHIWQEIGTIGRKCGLIWGGDWEGKKCDPAHFELPPEKG